MSDAFAELLKQVADEYGVTPEEVYREIEAAMAAGHGQPGPCRAGHLEGLPLRGRTANAGGNDRVSQPDRFD